MFVLVFPYHCQFYYGPHSAECLEDLWQDVGCLLKGSGAPRHMLDYQFMEMQGLNLEYAVFE